MPVKQTACPLNVLWPEGMLHACNILMVHLFELPLKPASSPLCRATGPAEADNHRIVKTWQLAWLVSSDTFCPGSDSNSFCSSGQSALHVQPRSTLRAVCSICNCYCGIIVSLGSSLAERVPDHPAACRYYRDLRNRSGMAVNDARYQQSKR